MRLTLLRVFLVVIGFLFFLIFLPFRILNLFRRNTGGSGPLKLYRRQGAEMLYWETWADGGGNRTVHWGKVGERGESRTVPKAEAGSIDAEAEARRAEGYAEIPHDDLYGIEVVYEIEGWGGPGDLPKRHRLEERLDQTLGWTGLGHMDGGSIGSGTMESFFDVVDPDIARRVIEENLRGTEFADYSEIRVHPPFSQTAEEDLVPQG